MTSRAKEYEEGWPARDFSEEARDYLLSESRQRVQEQLSHIGGQDVKSVAIFTASALVVSAAGLLGDLRFEYSVVGILSPISLLMTVATWFCVWQAYRAFEVGTGVDVSALRQSFAGASARELKDIAIETLVVEFDSNRAIIAHKAKWLSRAGYTVAFQVLLTLTLVISAQLIDDQRDDVMELDRNRESSAVIDHVSPMCAAEDAEATDPRSWFSIDRPA